MNTHWSGHWPPTPLRYRDFKKPRRRRQRKRLLKLKYKFALFVLAFIPIDSFNLYNVAELSSNRTGGVQVEKENETLPSCAHVLHKNVEFGHFTYRCCLAGYDEDMYQNLKRTGKAFVFLIFCDVLVAVAVVAS